MAHIRQASDDHAAIIIIFIFITRAFIFSAFDAPPPLGMSRRSKWVKPLF